MAFTGNQATLTFGTSSFTGAFTRIGESTQEIEDLEDSDLSTSGFKEYVASDLIEPGEFEVELFYDVDEQPTLKTAETITITYPLTPGGGNTNEATYAGTGYVKSFTTPELVNGSLMRARFTVKWDGKTGPAFTDES